MIVASKTAGRKLTSQYMNHVKYSIIMSLCSDKSVYFPSIPVELDAQDVLDQLPHRGNVDEMLEETAMVIEEARRLWSPQAILRNMDIVDVSEGNVIVAGEKGESPVPLKMGYSATFMRQAQEVVLGAYGVGSALERASARAAATGDYLQSYLYERVATAVLAKVAAHVNRHIEKEAAARGWFVGPLLSPGSVHGWELVEQRGFCSLLDLESVGIHCSDCGVLTPFNSLSFMIGTGPAYTRSRVGSPCEVCRRRETCQMNSGRLS